jgi:hypothetical protein
MIIMHHLHLISSLISIFTQDQAGLLFGSSAGAGEHDSTACLGVHALNTSTAAEVYQNLVANIAISGFLPV